MLPILSAFFVKTGRGCVELIHTWYRNRHSWGRDSRWRKLSVNPHSRIRYGGDSRPVSFWNYHRKILWMLCKTLNNTYVWLKQQLERLLIKLTTLHHLAGSSLRPTFLQIAFTLLYLVIGLWVSTFISVMAQVYPAHSSPWDAKYSTLGAQQRPAGCLVSWSPGWGVQSQEWARSSLLKAPERILPCLFQLLLVTTHPWHSNYFPAGLCRLKLKKKRKEREKVCVCECMSVCVVVSQACLCTCMWRPEVKIKCLPQLFFALILRHSLLLTWTLVFGWRSCTAPGTSCLLLPKH